MIKAPCMEDNCDESACIIHRVTSGKIEVTLKKVMDLCFRLLYVCYLFKVLIYSEY